MRPAVATWHDIDVFILIDRMAPIMMPYFAQTIHAVMKLQKINAIFCLLNMRATKPFGNAQPGLPHATKIEIANNVFGPCRRVWRHSDVTSGNVCENVSWLEACAFQNNNLHHI